jgi:fatty acid amide hydrolase 2
MNALHAPIAALGRMLRTGEHTPETLLQAHIDRIETVDGPLNAMAVRRYQGARADARRATEAFERGEDRGPLHGIPCTVKEFLAVDGLPHTGGLFVRREHRATRDATLVRRLREAGAVVLGTTNAPEGGLWHETHNRVYGRTSNPHDLHRSSGGSSGGEGAIIAAGGSPFGIGSDVGGSIRIPAGFCGIYGHKPTHGLVPNTGHFPDPPPEPYMACGPMARSAHDLMPVLRVLAGPDGQDPQTTDRPLGDPAAVDIARTRVLICPTNGQASVDPAIANAVREAGRRLADAGAHVEEIVLPEMASAFDIWAVRMSDLGVLYDELVTDGGRVRLLREFSRWARGKSVHTGSVLAMIAIERVLKRLPDRSDAMIQRARALDERLADLLGDDGVLLHPVFSRIAPRHRTIGIGNPADVGLTAVFNILGHPVTVAPVGRHRGLPTSVQIVGPHGADHRTIAAAMVLEAAHGPFVPTDPHWGPAPRGLVERLR